jgi:hypothetical protein
MLGFNRTGLAAFAAGTALLISGCGNSSGGGTSAASPTAAATTAPTAAAGFTDLAGVFGADQIAQLAQLGVFESNSGTFEPAKPITRGKFVRWLVQANNAIWADDPSKVIRTSSSATSAFPDVPTSHPDFAYIQGMYDAGFAIGFSDKLFHPDEPLTHEQMLAIKESVDRGGIDKYYEQFWDSTMPDWKDRDQIDKRFRAAIAEDSSFDKHYPDVAVGNIGRAFGAIAMLRPRQPVTRAEAAACIWKIGAHNESTGDAGMPRSAADALKPSPVPSPT